MLEKFFKLKENGTTPKTEIIAGITTFVTMAYIIFVNPSILSNAGMNEKGLLGSDVIKAGLSIGNDKIIGAVFVATVISAIIATLIMGLFANVPFAQAAGMGMNAFFTFYVVLYCKISWQGALAAVFICGVINILITVTKVRVAIINAIPESLKKATGAGIGLFISLIGMKEAGFVVSSPDTLLAFGNINKPATLLAFVGLALTVILMVRNVKGSILIGIVVTTIIAVFAQTAMGIDLNLFIPKASEIISAPPSLAPTFLKLSFKDLFSSNVGFLSLITIIVSFSLVDTFDTIGTFIGTTSKTDIFKDKESDTKGAFPKKLDRALFADAVATSIGSLIGTSNVTTYVESLAGISAGGRTGLTAVVTAICFFLTLFISPLIGIVPAFATAPALIVVGILMMGSIMGIDFDNLEEAIPAFFTVAIMPFTYSIANGIAVGFIFYTLVKLFKGKAKEIHPIMYLFTLLFIIKFALQM